MTVIAYDGQIVAADKRACLNGMHCSVAKIFKDGDVIRAATGQLDIGMSMIKWHRDGASPDNFPEIAKDSDRGNSTLIVFDKSGVHLYEQSPVPFTIQDGCYAWGSGAPYALAAMRCGLNAVQAVQLAIDLCVYCGDGIDVLKVSTV